ncbi:MAG: InlB B-repeat-containing protein, partial [Alphaproteobacteria bacterium]|nr:InlB B-repeat-containing protein [Alphaproteobacteria bacterium]
GNIWYTADNSGYRCSCYHHSDATDTDVDTGYSYNCATPTLVACEGGYYDDGKATNASGYRVCVAVGEDYWSPDIVAGQEPEVHANNPTTQRTACPPDTSTEGVTTAYSESQCIGQRTACQAGKSYANKTHTTCAIPYYCPGDGDVLISGAGCQEECPEAGWTIATGVSSVNECHKTFQEGDDAEKVFDNGTAEWDCTWKGTVAAGAYSTCSITVLECEDGYYNPTDTKACLDVTSGYYSPAPSKDRSACPTKTNYSVGSDGTRATNENCYIACSSYIPAVDYSINVAVSGDAKKYYSGGAYGACEYTVRCMPGYDAVNGANPQCTPRIVTVTLDDTIGSGGVGVIYQKYNTGWYANSNATTELQQVVQPSATDYSFLGYFTAETGGDKIIDSDGTVLGANTLYTDNTTLYAQWLLNVVDCQTGKYYDSGELKSCVVPYYCSGEGTSIEGKTGCYSVCPQDGYTKIANADNVEMCYKKYQQGDDPEKVFDNGTAEWECKWKGTVQTGGYAECNITVLTCDAGYYQKMDSVACSEVESGYYSPAPSKDRIACPEKQNYQVGSDAKPAAETDCYIACSSHMPTVEHVIKIAVQGDSNKYYSGGAYGACEYAVECDTGYTPVNGVNPQCVPVDYTVKLNKNGGTGNVVDSVQCTFDSGACALPANNALVKPGYNVVAKWCTNADGSGECYDAGSIVTTNISADASEVMLFAVWTPGVFKITLTATDATENAIQNPVYLKYATGWYADSGATQPIANIGTNLPQKTGYVFAGYRIGEDYIIVANGALQTSETVLKITTQDTTATVGWSAGVTKCAAGTYYPGMGNQCAECIANNYCPGGEFATDSGVIGGLNPCPNGGKSAGGVSATTAGVCYKTDLTYVSSSQRATGSQSCFWGTVAYSESCYDIEIKTCVAGYWYDVAQSTTDCVEVGENYYSGKDVLVRTVCPDGGNTEGKTTAAAITECVKRVNTYVSATKNAMGSYVCYADDNGTYNQFCQEDTIIVNWCKGGYWYNESQSKTDCVEVEENYYSPEGDMTRAECPHGGTTATRTASTPHGICKKSTKYPGLDYTGAPVHGTGTQGCFYDSASDGKMFGSEKSDGYLLNCEDIFITKCDSGYYWAHGGTTVCIPVGIGAYGPVAGVNNNNLLTARAICPDNGKTQSDISDDVTACYRTVEYKTERATGTQVCSFGTNAYDADCRDIVIEKCAAGYWYDAAQSTTDCVAVGDGYYSGKDVLVRSECPDGGNT